MMSKHEIYDQLYNKMNFHTIIELKDRFWTKIGLQVVEQILTKVKHGIVHGE